MGGLDGRPKGLPVLSRSANPSSSAHPIVADDGRFDPFGLERASMTTIAQGAPAPVIAAVTFAGATLTTILHEGEEFAAIRPICDAIGLAWNGQWERISRDDVLSATVRVIRTVAQDGKEREIIALPLKLLNGWLFGIDTSRVKNEAVRARVIEYKRECYDVLHNYWTKGGAINPRAYSVGASDTLTAEQADTLRRMLTDAVKRLPKDRQAAAMIKGWSKLKAHFKTDYRRIPQAEFPEAVSIVARHIAEQGELLDAEPKHDTLNETVAGLVRQVEAPNGAPAAVFMPLVNAVLRKQGFELGARQDVTLKGEQAKEIEERLGRLMSLFHPFSAPFMDAQGVLRALRGRHPRLGVTQPGYLQVLQPHS
jgi:hypothetical protein